MKLRISRLALLLLAFFSLTHMMGQGGARETYINKYYQIAIFEMQTYGIPASITMAQGILESGNGLGYLAFEANNHFGIKCHDWTGPSVRKDDDAKDECFRKYDDPKMSYEDHSKFLTTRSRYAFLFDYDQTDYVRWAKGLKKAGYATDPKYPNKLIKIIEDNELYLLDEYALAKKPDDSELPAAVTPRPMDEGVMVAEVPKAPKTTEATVTPADKAEVLPIKEGVQMSEGGLRFLVSQGKTSYADLAVLHDLHLWEIYRYNDLKKGDKTTPQKGERVYLQNKKYKSHDKKASHKAQEGDTMYELAQRYGIRVKSLYRINGMFRGMQPKAGDVIYLHRKAKPKQSNRR